MVWILNISEKKGWQFELNTTIAETGKAVSQMPYLNEVHLDVTQRDS